LERTLVLLKPDAVQRGLIGRILARFEDKGLRVVGLKLRKFPPALVKTHYAEHQARPFYASLVRFMTSGPAVGVVLEGKDAVAVTRRLMGETDGATSPPGTIRGDFGMSRSNNLVHGSDSLPSAKREIALFFPERDEVVAWMPVTASWVYGEEDLGAAKTKGKKGGRAKKAR